MTTTSGRRLDTSLQCVESRLQSFVTGDGIARIRNLAAWLPASAVDFFGFECRLGGGAEPVDCAINLTPEGAKMLAGRHGEPPAEMSGGYWNKLRAFYQEWGDTREPAYVDAGATWIEFDMGSGVPAPNLLFGYWPEKAERRSPEWLIESILPGLLGGPLSAGFRENLYRALHSRPAGTDDFQIGAMFSREIQVVRVCVFDLPKDQVFPYLESIGWKGPAAEAGEFIEAFRQCADFVGLHLDIGERVYPHIGIEPNFVAGCWSRQPPKETRWADQFDILKTAGLLQPAKHDALLSWIGHQRVAFDGEENLLLRGLSHLKVVLRPGAPTAAKAYFGIAHRALAAAAGGQPQP